MNKDQLQQEILKKVKPGIKPSDLKKRQEENSQLLTPPPTPPLKPKPEPIILLDELEREEELSPPKNKTKKQLQEEVNYWSQAAQNYLTNFQKVLTENELLKEQTKPEINHQLEQALMEANQKIRELATKNKSLIENITNLEKQTKSQAKSKPTLQTPSEEKKFYLFTCDICQANKKSQLHRERINGLGYDPQQYYKICNGCIQKVDVITPRETAKEFFGF